ncbi:MAG TPA: hypothetical protein VK576_11270, partial [Thermoleophilia bacterium]|nr:hypothetical protein [Thermoleophilia bacterium]
MAEVRKAAGPEARRRFGRYYTPPQIVHGLFELLAAGAAAEGLRPRLLIDSCCGAGAFLGAPQAAQAGSLLGLDLDPDALAEARRVALGAVLVQGDAYGE